MTLTAAACTEAVPGPAGPKSVDSYLVADGGVVVDGDAAAPLERTDGAVVDDGGAVGAPGFDLAHIEDYITDACSACHGRTRPAAGLNLSRGAFRANTVGVASGQVPGLALIEPGDPDASYLLLKLGGPMVTAGFYDLPECVENPDVCGDAMPRRGPSYPTAALMAELRAYIEAGAPPGSPPG